MIDCNDAAILTQLSANEIIAGIRKLLAEMETVLSMCGVQCDRLLCAEGLSFERVIADFPIAAARRLRY
jgi:hypothetical protein